MSKEVIHAVERYLREYLGERISVISSTPVGGGCINQTMKLETSVGDLFLKWNTNCSPDMFVREAESLKELEKASDGMLKVPKVFCAKEVDDSPGFLIQEYLEPFHAYTGIDEELGRGLAIIHQFRAERFGFYSDNYCGATIQDNSLSENWSIFFRDKRLGFLLQLIKKDRPLSVDHERLFDLLLDKITDVLPGESTPVLIHGDLWSGNYMSTSQGPALIDPASYYADREMEFAIITMFGGFSSRFFDAYNEVDALPVDWRSRNHLYQLYHVLNHYYLFGSSYLHQALSIAKRFIF